MTGANDGADSDARQRQDDGFSHVPRTYPGRYRWVKIRNGAHEVARQGGAVMDPVVAVFGTAPVDAIAADAWQQVHQAVTGPWRRVHPRREDHGVGAELDEPREQVLVARRDGNARTERALERAWQLRLQQLLRADPALAGKLQRVRDQVLTPAGQPGVGTVIMTGSSHDSSSFTQVNYPRP